jgi:succinate dehydrogenase / fumarate reductase flavoprotein subunit
MSESLRNDGRVWVPKKKDDNRPPTEIPEEERDYYLERRYPAFGNLVPRDVASRAAKQACDEGRGVGTTGLAVYLDFANAIEREGIDYIRNKYGNLFDMYEKITAENPYEVPMRIFPAVHYTMGGLWVDYNLMSTIPGLFVLGEANFSDHGANRLGASALMQGLADGYFVIPFTIGDYFGNMDIPEVSENAPEFSETADETRQRLDTLLSIEGSRSPREFHRELGRIMWDDVGMSRNEEGLKNAITEIQSLREEYWKDLKVPGGSDYLNKYLEFAGRVADFMELGELMARDALHREESCGGHFREEYQTEEGEALRRDDIFAYAAAWEFRGPDKEPGIEKENFEFENVKLATRSYK